MRIHGAGLRAWVVQRLTAMFMAGFILAAIILLLATPPGSYTAWREWIAHPVLSLASALFFASLLMHAWVGMRDVIMDYISSTGIRFCLLVVVGGFLFAMAMWVLRVLFVSSVI